jgi:hypothetical protein
MYLRAYKTLFYIVNFDFAPARLACGVGCVPPSCSSDREFGKLRRIAIKNYQKLPIDRLDMSGLTDQARQDGKARRK